MSDAALSPAPATPDDWSRLEQVVDAALDLPPEARARFVDDWCANDRALHDRALAWVRGCERNDGLLDAPGPMDDLLDALALLAPPTDADGDAGTDGGEDDPPLSRIGGWRLVRRVGSGGMGAVYLAQRDDAELPMRAAVKVLRGAVARHPLAVRRFRDERRILAALDHPAIARLLDGGLTDQGLPWFAMEYVAGAPIDDWCDRRALSIEARLLLFAQACDAVQHAHAHLVVHRDLKPANVFVSDEGAVKLLDFGIAKLLTPDSTSSDPLLTSPGFQPMTRAYAAPEQLRGEPASTATDIHALGVLLHVLLTGHLPLSGGSTVVRPSADVGRTSLRSAAPDDNTLPARIARARGTTPARLQRRLRGDLDTIVARAMRHDARERYATAHELAADVRRHLQGLPVLARPTSVAYRLRKLIGRSPIGTAAATAATVVLVGFASITALQASQLRAQAARVTAERDKAAEVTTFLSELLSSADPYRTGRVPTLREVLERGADRAASLDDRPEVQAHLLGAMARAFFGLGDWTRAGDLAAEAVVVHRRTRAPNDPALAAALLYLANVRLNDGRAADAIDHAREALQIHRSHAVAAARDDRPDSAPDAGLDSARILSTLGAALQSEGRLAEADAVLRALLATERAREPASPVAVAQVARNLAHVLRDAGQHAEAATLYAEAYALHRAAHGDEHPETANSAVNLGTALTRTGRLAEGERLLREGVSVKRRLLGIEHRDVAHDQLTLARVLASRGATGEADRLRAGAEASLARGRSARGDAR